MMGMIKEKTRIKVF